jgi:hypothetical protein
MLAGARTPTRPGSHVRPASLAGSQSVDIDDWAGGLLWSDSEDDQVHDVGNPFVYFRPAGRW